MDSQRYYFGVNNRPNRFEAVLEQQNGQFAARSTTMGWSFEGAGESSEDALAALQKSMEKVGWFVHQPFTLA